MITFGTVI